MSRVAPRQIDTWPIPFRLDWSRDEVDELTLGELLDLLADRAEAAGRRVDPLEEARRLDVAVFEADRSWFLEVEAPRIRAWAGAEERAAFERAEVGVCAPPFAWARPGDRAGLVSRREVSLAALAGPGDPRADLVRLAVGALARPEQAWHLLGMVDRHGRERLAPSGQWWPRRTEAPT